MSQPRSAQVANSRKAWAPRRLLDPRTDLHAEAFENRGQQRAISARADQPGNAGRQKLLPPEFEIKLHTQRKPVMPETKNHRAEYSDCKKPCGSPDAKADSFRHGAGSRARPTTPRAVDATSVRSEPRRPPFVRGRWAEALGPGSTGMVNLFSSWREPGLPRSLPRRAWHWRRGRCRALQSV